MTGVDVEHTNAQLLPDLPGCTHGVVGRDPWVIQCDGCGLTIRYDGREHKAIFFRRITFYPKVPGRRMCEPCWQKAIPDYDSEW